MTNNNISNAQWESEEINIIWSNTIERNIQKSAQCKVECKRTRNNLTQNCTSSSFYSLK